MNPSTNRSIRACCDRIQGFFEWRRETDSPNEHTTDHYAATALGYRRELGQYHPGVRSAEWSSMLLGYIRPATFVSCRGLDASQRKRAYEISRAEDGQPKGQAGDEGKGIGASVQRLGVVCCSTE